MPKITNALALKAKAQPQPGFVWDSVVSGFGLRVSPNGRRVYVARFRVGPGGRKAPKRLVTIGPAEALDAGVAPCMARRMIAAALVETDPMEERRASRSEPSIAIVDRILETGLEPFSQPPLLPPIEEEDVELICWMGVRADVAV
jgi:hypothetical protein